MVCANATFVRVGEEGSPIDRVKSDDGRPALLTVHDVAEMLNCSARTVYRLNDAGRMPQPVRLRALVRWSRDAMERWIAAGCPKVDQEVLS